MRRTDDPPAVDELEDFLRSIAPAGSTVIVKQFDSGAFDVEVRRSDGPLIVAQGIPSRPEFGITPDLRHDDAGFDSGHPIVCHTYREAVTELKRACTPSGPARRLLDSTLRHLRPSR